MFFDISFVSFLVTKKHAKKKLRGVVIMGVGTHKHDCLVSLNDFAFTNALVKRGGRRSRGRKRIIRTGNEEEEDENDDDFFGTHDSITRDVVKVHDGIRPIRIEFAREGNCVITVGKTDGDSNECQTKAHCAVTSMLKAPLGRAAEGSLRVHVKMSPMAHPTDAPVEKRRDNETCANLAKMIEKCFRDARALDLESLCVSAGRYAWHLRLDVTILNHGGDLPLAASVGANCALMSFRRCECSIDNETNRVTFHEERESVKLQLMHHPVAVRFAFYDGRNSKGSGFDEDEENNEEEEENNKPHQKYGILADAGVEEEACAIGFATVAVNEHGETCFSTMDFMGERLGKSVTRGVDATTLAEVHSTASNLAKEVCKEMKEAHERFEQKRLEEKTRRRKYDPDALERAALKADADEKEEEEEEEEYKDKDALLEDAEAMDEEARASEDSPDDEEDDVDAEEHVPLVSLKPPQNKSSSSSSSASSSEDDGEKSSEAEDDDIDDMFDKAEKKQAKKRAKIAAKTWDEALPGDGKKLSDAVMKRKKPNKKAPAKAKKLTKK